MTSQIQAYLQEVTQIYPKGNATEHTYRPALKRLLESFGKDIIAPCPQFHHSQITNQKL